MAERKKMLTYVFNERPSGEIEPGRTFRAEEVDRPTEADLKDGEVLFELNYLSLDPAMRGWLSDRRSYIPGVPLGDVMRGWGIGRILASRHPKFAPGDLSTGMSGWREVAVLNGADPHQVMPARVYPGTDITDIGGVLGLTGMTAYFGLQKIGEPRPGELVVVSGAAGATGSIVGQICKIKRARVLGIAGSDEKCRWLTDELGFDGALNYKSADFEERFLEATKGFIDVYWDNVGGKVLDLAMLQAKEHARFVMCGRISIYNQPDQPEVFYNFRKVTALKIRMQGFIVTDYMAEVPQATEEMAKWVVEGSVKSRSDIRKGGLKVAEQAILDLFRGGNTGKLLVEVKAPEDIDV